MRCTTSIHGRIILCSNTKMSRYIFTETDRVLVGSPSRVCVVSFQTPGLGRHHLRSQPHNG